jgi:hypothetical protein
MVKPGSAIGGGRVTASADGILRERGGDLAAATVAITSSVAAEHRAARPGSAAPSTATRRLPAERLASASSTNPPAAAARRDQQVIERAEAIERELAGCAPAAWPSRTAHGEHLVEQVAAESTRCPDRASRARARRRAAPLASAPAMASGGTARTNRSTLGRGRAPGERPAPAAAPARRSRPRADRERAARARPARTPARATPPPARPARAATTGPSCLGARRRHQAPALDRAPAADRRPGSRSRASAWLAADWVTPSRAAARVTWRSASTTSSTRSRLRSTAARSS